MLSGDILRLFEDKRGLLAVKNRKKHYEGGHMAKVPGRYIVKEDIEHDPDSLDRTHTCVQLAVVIKDVDECKYNGTDQAFWHACGSTAQCRNTEGAYYCECPIGMVRVMFCPQ
jgi:hypothetical protein